LAALVPKPRKNLVIYSGVLAPNAKLRRQVVQYGRGEVASDGSSATQSDRERDNEATSAVHPAERPNYAWAELMQRSFGIDVLRCKHCGGRLRLLCAITRPDTVRAILRSLGLPVDVDDPAPARAPLTTSCSRWLELLLRASSTGARPHGCTPCREMGRLNGFSRATISRWRPTYPVCPPRTDLPRALTALGLAARRICSAVSRSRNSSAFRYIM
jgi:hypothetical protein